MPVVEHPVFEPVRLGPVRLRNRVVKAATFEGMTPDGLVSDDLVEYHRRPAAGGVAMTTVAYCSASPEGRTFRHQLWMRPDALPGLRRLTDAVHDEGAAACLQLGHAGWFANPAQTREPAIGPSRVFSPNAMSFARAIDDAGLARLREDFSRSAAMAVDAGFDAIEVHLGHGYLLSQFLSPYTNRRSDAYGGDIEGRARFPREVLAAIRERVGERAAVFAKLNMTDGFAGGLTADDGRAVARFLDEDGTVDALQLTGGFTARSPMYLLRGDVPLGELVELERNAVRRFGMRLFARRLMVDHPFEEAFFASQARLVKDAVDVPVMLLGGVTRLDTMTGAIDEGFGFVAMARAVLREPDLVDRYRRGEATDSACIHCNRCIVEMERGGTRCTEIPTP